MLVKTIYFDVSIEYPASPSAFFGVNVNTEDLKRVVTTDNPLAYISKVSYGRIALVKFKSNYRQKEVKKAVQLKLGIVNGNLTVKDEQIISDLSLTIESAPGFDKTIRTMDDIIEFLDNGAEFHHRNGFAPVSFNTNYVYNNDPLATHSFTEYRVNLCEY